MSMCGKLLAAALIPGLFLPLIASGDDGGGWKMPNLNPFSRKGAPPTSAHISDDSAWKLPNLMPASSQKRTAATKTTAPSTFQKMTTGTKSMLAKTADALNPFDDANDKQPVRVTGSKNAARQAAAKKKAASGSWFPSMWPKPADDRPKDVNAFLSQPRPQP